MEAIIYTDIGRDGMMSGVNIKATVDLARELSVPVIASGGITDLERRESAVRGRSRGHSSAPSPAARSTRERWISRRRRSWPTRWRAITPNDGRQGLSAR